MEDENPLWGGGANFREIVDHQELFGHVSRTVKTFFIAIAFGTREACVRLLDFGHVAMWPQRVEGAQNSKEKAIDRRGPANSIVIC